MTVGIQILKLVLNQTLFQAYITQDGFNAQAILQKAYMVAGMYM
jgi:hypothetical protein